MKKKRERDPNEIKQIQEKKEEHFVLLPPIKWQVKVEFGRSREREKYCKGLLAGCWSGVKSPAHLLTGAIISSCPHQTIGWIKLGQ